MPPFRFQFPSFSFGSPSRLSSGTSSPSPPPTPPPPSRPPFRPAGIAQPSKPATSSETKSKVVSSLSRVKSNVAAMAAALSGSQSPSRSPATPTRLAKQSNQQSGSPLKKPESLRTEEEKVTVKGKTKKESGETSIVRSKQKEAEEAQEQSKKTELKKLAIQEKKKVLPKDLEEKSKAAHEQHKKGEVEKLGVQESKQVLRKDMEEKSKAAHDQHKKREVEKLGVQEKVKVLPKDMGEKSEAAKEQQKMRDDEILAVQESKTKPVLHEGGKEKSEAKGLQENREVAQSEEKMKEKEKLVLQETQRALQTTNREDATQGKTTGKIPPASGSTSNLRDQPETETKPQNKTEIHTNDDNQHKAKGVTMSTHGNPRNKSREESSSMSRKIKEDIRDGISKLAWGKSNGDEKSVSVITLTGENRGATMAIDSEKDKKSGEVPIRRGYKSIPNESPNTTTTETEEENKNSKDKNPKHDDKDEEEKKVRAYVNGNTQGINNSIVLDSSVSENDPGIHMSMKFEESHKEIINPPMNEPKKKPQVQKPEPRVRRRCLRGLLAESSESETKPRRHGCKFTCKDKDIENT